MKRAYRFVPILLAALLCVAFFPFGVAGLGADEDKVDAVGLFAKLERGMTSEQVRNRLGAPKHIARQILYHRCLEQWSYEEPLAVRLTFDCPRGQKPQLLYFPEFPLEKDERGGAAKRR